ncbi:kinase-like domain-containing protein [Favolaschia claudopus]|uniref:Kinase-like domain-containing protein n=1 Tax=Favolaschia claudopus TaxID=2862362 RepID=A0AAW0AUL2_9AGAR
MNAQLCYIPQQISAATLAKRWQDNINIIKAEIAHDIRATYACFNNNAIAHKATKIMGKEGHTSILPIGQGGYNSVLAVIFNDGSDIVVRLDKSPYNKAPPSEEAAKLMFESEVATLRFLKTHTSIPVPTVYYSNSDPAEAGARCTILETIPGISLEQFWYSMPYEEQQDIVAKWATMQTELTSLPFHEIGSLTTETGIVGPLCPSSLMPYTLREPHCGPFSSSIALLAGHTSSVIDGLEPNDENRHFFERFLAAILALPPEKFRDERLVLCHDDISIANILYAPPNKIVGIIDWQGSSVLPVWAAMANNDFLCGHDREGELRQQLPDAKEVTPIDNALRELRVLATGVKGRDVNDLRACFADLSEEFSWLSEPFLPLLME